MSKAKSKAKQMKGKMKESVGRAVDNRSMEAEGRDEQMGGMAEGLTAKASQRMKKSGR